MACRKLYDLSVASGPVLSLVPGLSTANCTSLAAGTTMPPRANRLVVCTERCEGSDASKYMVAFRLLLCHRLYSRGSSSVRKLLKPRYRPSCS